MRIIGKTIDNRYEVVEHIYTGGFAYVYRGRDIRLHNRPVAIKQLKPEMAENPGVLAMFRDEIQMSTRLRHHNIVQIYDQVAEEGDYFVLYEFVEGTNMKDLIVRAGQQPDPSYSFEAGRRMPPHLAAYIVREVCQALDYAHSLEDSAQHVPLHIVHRDISPQNILISYGGDVKLIDFGIAKARDELSKQERTKTGMMKGKPPYMSPEQVYGRPLDHTSDLYSLGVVLYEAVSGHKLYSADTEIELLRKVAKGGIALDQLNATAIPGGLRPVLARAIQVDRNMRYQSGRDLAHDLAEFLSGRHDCHQELSHYVQTMLRPGAAEAVEQTETIDSLTTGESQAETAQPPTALLQSTPAAAAQPAAEPGSAGVEESAVLQGERTIIDIIKITAYSGRRFFAIGGAIAAALFLGFWATDAFAWPGLYGRKFMAMSTWLYRLIFPPAARIVTFPPGAEVVLDDKVAGRSPLELSRVNPGRDYLLTMKLDGYEPIARSWTPREVPRGEVAVDTFRFHVPLIISSWPAGATVILDGVARGTTDMVIDRYLLSDRPTNVTLEHEGFSTLSAELVLDGDRPPLGPFLCIDRIQNGRGWWEWVINGTFYGFARIAATPGDAEIRISSNRDNQQIPYTASEIRPVAYGEHTVRVSRPPCITSEVPLNITSGDTTTLTVSLPRTVKVYGHDTEEDVAVTDGTVEVRGREYRLGRDFRLGLGSHPATIRAGGYQAKDVRIEVGTGGSGAYEFNLEPGGFNVEVEVTVKGEPPGDSQIHVRPVDESGKKFSGKLADKTTGIIAATLPSGKYQFEMTRLVDKRVVVSDWYEVGFGQARRIHLEFNDE